MKVGIIGAGNMGSAFARRLSAAGHQVVIASKDLPDAERVASSVGAAVRAVPQERLADDVELLIAATPWPHQPEAVRASGNLDGRIVIEISNPITEDMSGLAIGFETSAAEEVAKATRGATVVKAFNTVFAQVLGGASPSRSAGKVQVFYAGDDASAKSTVRSLIESMGFEPVDAGPLRNARLLEPLGMFNIYLGYGAGLGTDIAPAVRKVAAPASEGLADRGTRPSSSGQASSGPEGAREQERPPAR